MRKSEQAKEQLVVKMLCAFLSVKTEAISVEGAFEMPHITLRFLSPCLVFILLYV
jgi:hypothetical protein